jgi:hypothetical protein
VVPRFPKGASIEQISSVLEVKPPRRTLQRRLALLVQQKRLTVEGRGRGSRYQLRTITGEAHLSLAGIVLEAHGEVYVPISPDAAVIKQAVREPIPHRHPVGYNWAFLEAYQPNVTLYLAAETRQRLLALGRTPDGPRPAGTYARQIFSRLLIDLSWNSSRLEGNTYSLLDTERLLALGEAAEGKDALEAQMILNHKEAIELLVEQAARGRDRRRDRWWRHGQKDGRCLH